VFPGGRGPALSRPGRRSGRRTALSRRPAYDSRNRAALASRMSLFEVLFAIRKYEASGHLADGRPDLPESALAHWDASGLDAGAVAERLRGTELSLLALGEGADAAAAALGSALREVGLGRAGVHSGRGAGRCRPRRWPDRRRGGRLPASGPGPAERQLPGGRPALGAGQVPRRGGLGRPAAGARPHRLLGLPAAAGQRQPAGRAVPAQQGPGRSGRHRPGHAGQQPAAARRAAGRGAGAPGRHRQRTEPGRPAAHAGHPDAAQHRAHPGPAAAVPGLWRSDAGDRAQPEGGTDQRPGPVRRRRRLPGAATGADPGPAGAPDQPVPRRGQLAVHAGRGAQRRHVQLHRRAQLRDDGRQHRAAAAQPAWPERRQGADRRPGASQRGVRGDRALQPACGAAPSR